MKILVVGSGGREHALAWKLAQSERVQTVFVAPGNGGTELDTRLVTVDLHEPQALADFVVAEHIALTLVANQPLRTPASPYIHMLRVPAGFDEADQAIVQRVRQRSALTPTDRMP